MCAYMRTKLPSAKISLILVTLVLSRYLKGKSKRRSKRVLIPLLLKLFIYESPSPFKVAISVQEYLESSSRAIRHTFFKRYYSLLSDINIKDIKANAIKAV